MASIVRLMRVSRRFIDLGIEDSEYSVPAALLCARPVLLYQAAEKACQPVIPSEARDLLLFVFNKEQQMPRCARHDRRPFSAAC